MLNLKKGWKCKKLELKKVRSENFEVKKKEGSEIKS